MTTLIPEESTTVATEVPNGFLKRRRRPLKSPPPVVIEIRIDVTRDDPGAADPVDRSVENTIGKALKSRSNAESSDGILHHLGEAMQDRLEDVIAATAKIVESRIDDLAARADAEINRFVEDTVNGTMDILIQNLVEQRINAMFGLTLDLTEPEAHGDPSRRVIDLRDPHPPLDAKPTGGEQPAPGISIRRGQTSPRREHR